MKLTRFLIFSTLLVAPALALPAPEAEANVPEFRASVADTVFESRFEELRDRIGMDGFVEQAAVHPEGVKVTSVVPEGQAEKLGIVPGDYILEVGGKVVWHKRQDWQPDLPERELIIRKADGERQKHQIEAGKIGVFYDDIIGLEREFYHQEKPSRPWYDLVMGAIAVVDLAPEVAETAMHRAVELGYQPDRISSGVGIKIALRQNRPGEAWRFAEHIIAESGSLDEINRACRLPLIRAAFASARVKILKEIQQSWGDELLWVFDEVYDAWEASGAAENGWDPARRPSERLEEFGLRDRITHMEAVPDVRTPRSYSRARNLSERQIVTPGYWRRNFVRIKGGIRNCVWDAEFDAAQTAYQGKPSWRPVLRFRLYALAETRKLDRRIASVEIIKRPTEIGVFTSGVGMKKENPGKWGYEAAMNPVRVRLIRLDDQVEVQLDGSTILWMPCKPGTEDIGFYLFNSGMTIEIHKMRFWEILDPS